MTKPKLKVGDVVVEEFGVYNEKSINMLKTFLPYKLVKFNGNCGVCGGQLTLIRGVSPGCKKREVCPTCLMEITEEIMFQFNTETGQAKND